MSTERTGAHSEALVDPQDPQNKINTRTQRGSQRPSRKHSDMDKHSEAQTPIRDHRAQSTQKHSEALVGPARNIETKVFSVQALTTLGRGNRADIP